MGKLERERLSVTLSLIDKDRPGRQPSWHESGTAVLDLGGREKERCRFSAAGTELRAEFLMLPAMAFYASPLTTAKSAQGSGFPEAPF